MAKKCAYCTDGETVCASKGPGARGAFVCTREPMHDGDHVACSGNSHAVERWPGDGQGKVRTMEGKRRSRGLGPLERAQRAVEGKFPMVRREGPVLFVGSDGLLASKKGRKTLRLRFWTGAQEPYRTALIKALGDARIPYEVGPEYELEHKGRKMSPAPAIKLMEGTDEETMGRLERNPHVRACLICKEVLDQAAKGDLEYQGSAAAMVLGHVKQNPKPDAPACQYGGCIHHEDVSREFSRALMRVAKSEKPWKDARGVPVVTIPFAARKEDHPKCWDFKRQDAESRTFEGLDADEAGCIYLRLAPKKVTLHVWVEPQYASRRESAEDPATLEDVLNTYATKMPSLREWVMKKFNDLRGLAEMDLDLEAGAKS